MPTKTEQWCDEISQRSPGDVDGHEVEALLGVVRAADDVIAADADHGLAMEPEMSAAMDNLAVSLDACTTKLDTTGDDDES